MRSVVLEAFRLATMESVRLYNTLTRSVVGFDADDPVRLYVCGVTPYDTTHLGHARTYLIFDVLVRHLRASGRRVRYVQNVTDVDDSILAKAREVGEDWKALGERYARIYFDDCAALGLVEPDGYPRASEVIGDIQDQIARLVASGHAYVVDGDVFFRIGSCPTYGDLSRLPRERMLEIEAAQDGTTVHDMRKEDPLDFLLWRAHREPDEPSWDGPWGPGRPGWHIECSTIAQTKLANTIDIHGGGTDLIFPHHEAEICQAEASSAQRPFSRYWVHPEMVTLAGEKMSKSEGNMVFVRHLLDHYPPDAIRLYLLRGHYREGFDHDPEALEGSAEDAARLLRAAAGASGGSGVEDKVAAALDDDLDTRTAIDVLLRSGATGDALRAAASRLGLLETIPG